MKVLGDNGAQVLHPNVIDNNFQIPIHLRNTFEADKEGTMIKDSHSDHDFDDSGNGRILGIVCKKPIGDQGEKFAVNVVGSQCETGSDAAFDLERKYLMSRVIEELKSKFSSDSLNVRVVEKKDPWVTIEVESEEGMKEVATAVHDSVLEKGMFKKIDV